MMLVALRKLLSVLGVLFVVSAVVYILGRAVAPGDVAQIVAGSGEVSPEDVEALREELGLNQPLLFAYFDWLRGALVGDLGTSPPSGLTVRSQLAQQVPVSLELAFLALLVTTAVGVPLGIALADRASGRIDTGIRVALLTGFGIPGFVIAIVIVFVASQYVPSLYTTEYVRLSDDVLGNLRCMVLPVTAASIASITVTTQVTRSVMLEALNAPHIRMARAKGISPFRVKYVHALLNAAPEILTLLAFLFGILLGGLVVTETVFNLPGLGRGMIDAIGERDFILLVPQTIIVAGIFVTANMLVETLHPVLDPRLRAQ